MSTLPERTELDPQAPAEPSSIGSGSLAETPVLSGDSPPNRNPDFCSEELAGRPLRIGAGSFAEVFMINGGPIAYKQMYGFDGAALRFEYDALSVIHDRCDTGSFFALPQPFAFNDPSGLVDFATTFPGPPQYRPRPVPPIVTQELLSIFRSPTYAMDRVQALPPRASDKLLALYFPPTIKTGPMLCRLYFGKSFAGARVPKFFNTENFPLDEDRYNALVTSFPGLLPSVQEVARGMGEMLARLHFRASIDARDVEFVLGGDGGAGFTFFVIDFNQVRYWPKTVEGIDALVSAFFANDPYYPRPRPSDPLYTEFKEAYLAECAGVVPGAIGQTFIDAIEAEQLTRDLRFATSSRTPPP